MTPSPTRLCRPRGCESWWFFRTPDTPPGDVPPGRSRRALCSPSPAAPDRTPDTCLMDRCGRRPQASRDGWRHCPYSLGSHLRQVFFIWQTHKQPRPLLPKLPPSVQFLTTRDTPGPESPGRPLVAKIPGSHPPPGSSAPLETIAQSLFSHSLPPSLTYAATGSPSSSGPTAHAKQAPRSRVEPPGRQTERGGDA